MVLIRLEICVKVFGFEASFCRNMMSDLRIFWVWGEESKVIKVARFVSFALMLGVECRLFRWFCGGVGVVNGRAGKSCCSVKLTFGLGLVCCLRFITFGHSSATVMFIWKHVTEFLARFGFRKLGYLLSLFLQIVTRNYPSFSQL